jgi:hypothetical protein
MEEPPNQNHRRYNQQPKRLVAPKRPSLVLAPLLLGHLFEIWLDAAFHH